LIEILAIKVLKFFWARFFKRLWYSTN